MSRRFLAIAGRDTSPPHRLRDCALHTLGLSQAYASPRLWIFSDEPVTTLEGRGAIVGALFSQEGFEHRVTLTRAQTEAVVISRGQTLIDNFWGAYVALFETSDDGGVEVLRDPSGGLAVYYAQTERFSVVASDPATLTAMLGHRPAIDWTRIHAHLLDPVPDRHHTGLEGVFELPPGERASLAHSIEREALWTPWAFARDRYSDNFANLAQALEHTALGCVKAWASGFQKVSLGVSGGLDSSVVAACLRETGATPTFFTMVTDDAEGDERPYAKTLTDFLGAPLYERRYRVEDVDIAAPAAVNRARPSLTFTAQTLAKVREDLQRDLGVHAHFSGGGGDNLFCLSNSAAPLVDKFESDGWRPGLWRVLGQISRLTQASALDIVATARRIAASSRRFAPPPAENRFLKGSSTASAAYHPWLNAPSDMLPGKARHVGMLALAEMGAQGNPGADGAPFIQPLLAQPMMELCLRVPSWIWSTGGVNRAPVRTAFANRLPPALIARTSKGGPTSFSQQIYHTHRLRLREQLLGGLVIDHLPIDRHALDQALLSDRPASLIDMRSILSLACVEAWARAYCAAA